MRLPLDDNATVEAVIADSQLLHAHIEVVALARESEQGRVSFRRIDAQIVTHDAIASGWRCPRDSFHDSDDVDYIGTGHCLEGKAKGLRSGETINESCTLPRRLRASAWDPAESRSSHRITSQRMNPRAMSVWIVAAASRAVCPRRNVQARVSFSPAVKNAIRPSAAWSRWTISSSAEGPSRNAAASSSGAS